MNELTSERLRELLNFDPDTGVFTRRVSKGAAKTGSVAGVAVGSSGYLRIMIDGRSYLAHRLAWLYMTGEWPKDEIDHRNRIKTDNRLHNLREATHTLNARNRTLSKAGTLPVGVRPWRGKFKAVISPNNKYLGLYETPEEAHDAYQRAARARYGEFMPEG